MVDMPSEKNDVLEKILRAWDKQWESNTVAVEGFYSGWPQFLQDELKAKGYYIMLVPTW